MTTNLRAELTWAIGIILLALAATSALSLGYLSADAVTRIVLGATGLMLAWYGNRMPKAAAPNDCARRIARVGGWSMAVSGMAYALLWAFAPMDVALVAGCGAIIAGIAITFAYSRKFSAGAR